MPLITLQSLIKRAGFTSPYKFACTIKDTITYGTLRNWYTGRSIPTLDIFTLETLLKILDCTFNEFLDAVRNSHALYIKAPSPKVNKVKALRKANKKRQKKIL